MKKLFTFLAVAGALVLSAPSLAYADIGDLGFYGGISEGRKLPKTTETKIKESGSAKNKKTVTDTFSYSELIVIAGEPYEFNGKIEIKVKGGIDDKEENGTYTVQHTIEAKDNAPQEVDLYRDITYNVQWRREGTQYIINYEVDKDKWEESITIGEEAYFLDDDRSHMNLSFIQDKTPGVEYYKGNLTSISIYYAEGEDEDDDGSEVKVQSSATIYGYSSAWSSTETHRINTWVYGDGWQMQYQMRPSVSVAKTMQYSQNEPTAISFVGNYTEITQNQSALSYNIYNKPVHLYNLADSGSISIDSYNNIEQLVAPDLTFLKGHFAEDDIKRLFSMQVLTGETHYYKPDQAMTRGQFVEALAKAVNLPIEQQSTKKSSKKSADAQVVFPDVQPERSEYPYIMAIYNAGLAIGRDTGNFFIDAPIQRQEAVTILIRTLGLEHLGLDPAPVTSFVDDGEMGDWARKEINAASLLGLIGPDDDGKFYPTKSLTKAEGAAILNSLINYMRQDMITDYTDHIINFPD